MTTVEPAPAPTEETLRELELEVFSAEREREQAHEQWRRVERNSVALNGDGRRVERFTTVNAAGNERADTRVVRTTIDVGGAERYVDELDEVDRATIREKLNAERLEAASAVQRARARLNAAREKLANAKLEPATQEYGAAAATLEDFRRQVEHHMRSGFALLLNYGEARRSERRALRRVLKIAIEAAHDAPALRDQVQRIEQDRELPLRFVADGRVESRDAATLDLLGDSPTEQQMWAALAQLAWLAVNEPQRAAARLRELRLITS